MTLHRIKTCIFIVLHVIVALSSLGSVSATTHYVVSEQSTPCPEPGNDNELCLTLSQYARNSSNFDSNTTLILLPGNHSLETDFFVQNIETLTMESVESASNSDTVINCSHSASFRFENISVVRIRGLELTGCVNNIITLVEQLTVEDCNLQGQSTSRGMDGTGLGLYNVASAYIVRSTFSFFSGVENFYFRFEPFGVGAFFAVSDTGDCSIMLNNSSFFNNAASHGGAVQAISCSITLNNNCLFRNNRALVAGGAVWVTNWPYADGDCVINIDKSKFINNTASSVEDDSEGGAVWVQYCSELTITNSLFDSNSVDGNTGAFGGAVRASLWFESDVTIDNSKFINNIAASTSMCTGGAVDISSAPQSNTNISNSKFIDNSCKAGISALGGAIWVKNRADPSVDCVINIDKSNFINNTASSVEDYSEGGAVWVQYCSELTITNSLFDSNSVDGNTRAFGGAVRALWLEYKVTIDNSKFINNIAASTLTCNGGAVDISSAPQSNTTISNSEFIDNSCTATTSGSSAYGGAFHSARSWSVSFTKPITIMIDNCTFNKNTATGYEVGYGGAILSSSDADTIIFDSKFMDNTANGSTANGGALHFVGSGWYTYNFTRITANGSAGNGGALHFVRSSSYIYSSNRITIHNCTFCKNTARGFERGYGGVMLTRDNTATKISESQFIDNTANGKIALAGAILNYCNLEFSKCNIFVTDNSMFHNNSVSGNDLSIGGAMLSVGNADITISDSEFTKNSASSSSSGVESGLGGVVSSYNGNLFLNNSRFTENIATGAFGAVLTLANCSLTSHGFLDIVENTADTFVLIAINSTMHFSGDTKISNNNGYALQVFLCPTVRFTGNTNIVNNYISSESNHGTNEVGTVTGIHSTIDFDGFNNIMYNKAIRGGAISATQSTITLLGNVTIAHNEASISGGGIYALQSNLQFKNTNNNIISLIDNKGTKKGGAIHAISSTLSALDSSRTYIVRNNAERGGGVCLESNSKLYIFKNTAEKINDTSREEWIRMEFRENIAVYGGALYITDDTNSETCNAIPFSGESTTSNECFIQGLGTVDTLSLVNFDRIQSFRNSISLFGTQNLKNTYFFNNTASEAGNSIYGGLLDRCKISPTADILFDGVSFHPYNSMSATSYLLIITDITLPKDDNKEISSSAVRVCFCREKQPNCSYQPGPLYVSKGQAFNVSLVAVDQLENIISNTTIIHGFVNPPASLGEGESIQQTNKNGTCTNLTYSILSSETEEQLFLYADGPCMSAGLSLANITVSFESCPVGFVANDTTMRCDCDPVLLNGNYIQSCSINNGTVLRREGVWIDYSWTNDTAFILHKHCPFDYCVKSAVPVNLSNPDGSDSQCDFNRAGKLCGSCNENYSLSLGNSHCIPDSECSDLQLALLIIAFALAGVALVAFILVCNLTVAVGTINGLILYANILTTNRATFLPFSDMPGIFFTVFIAWLNLDFGIVTCFYEGMNAYAKEWYQIIFPLYIILMVAIVIIACEYSTRIARFFTKTHPVAALATLILLSYTKSLRVIIAAFSPAKLTLIRNNSNSSTETVWLIDASIKYFEWKSRFPFLLVAVLILLVGIAYTLFLFSYQWLLRCSYNRALEWIRSARFYPFMDAYHAPYNKKYRYWTGLLLFVRAFLYITTAANDSGDPNNNLLSISITMATLCLLKMVLYSSVYKSRLLDILEMSLILFLTSSYSVLLHSISDRLEE